ncbi:hypothetical protein ACWEPN_31845 [Nonomuraea wenchangensis]
MHSAWTRFSGGLGIVVGVIKGFATGLAVGAGSCLVSYASE